ncbi:hypothetical protein GWK47_052865 [Chionoecetes opilio]|uniref:Uncharacterized protein n=1 Tax=Chionoecetes opilio TaxID=41210 RepID=A0A8J4Y115_CHIOP|nr:hypothetical protein GWK47_052865 [Chionoecetes opilio]
MPFVAAKRGHFWRLCPASPPRAALVRPPIIQNLTPTSGAVIFGMEMAASLPVVISSLTPSRHVSLHSSGGHWGASVCGGSPTVGGPRHIPTSAPGYTHGSHPRCRGEHAPLGTITCQVSVGTVSTTECIYIAKGVQQLYLSLKGMQGPSPGPAHLPAPPFTTSVCAVEPIRHPTRPTSPRETPPHELVEEKSRSPRESSWSTSGALCLPWDGTPLSRDERSPHHVHLRPHTTDLYNMDRGSGLAVAEILKSPAAI